MAIEVELKLAITQEAAETIAASGVFSGGSTTTTQRSVYFDTPDHQLFEAGLTLRIRTSGSKRIQTIKAGDGRASGLFARSEWERPVENDEPIIDEKTPIRTLIGDDCNNLSPVFEVHVERKTWHITEGDAVIEVVLDRGHVVADGRQSPICEIEIELKQGNPNALFALARKVDEIAPVRLGVSAKSERGYWLTGPAATVFKADRVILDKDTTAAQAAQRIVQNCIRQYRLNEAEIFGARNAEALHQARVAIRRLRSAFSIFKPLFGEELALRDELRWLAVELGEARNLDVLLERSEPGSLRDRLNTARDDAYAAVEAGLASRRVRSLMLDLAQWINSGSWQHDPETRERCEEPIHDFAGGVLDRLRRRVKRGGRKLVKADDEARHELRKDGKKLRYAAEFFSTVFDRRKQNRRRKHFVGALEGLQDQLGLLNDLATGPSVLETLGLTDDPHAAALLAGRGKGKLLRAAADAHDELVDAKPFWR
jgi:triphosphatase